MANRFYFLIFLLAFTACKPANQTNSKNREQLSAKTVNKLWEELTVNNQIKASEYGVKAFKLWILDTIACKDIIKNCTNQAVDQSEVILKLPLPDGQLLNYKIVRSGTMSDELAKKFPNIQTYKGVNINDQSIVTRLEWTTKGFHASIYMDGKSAYIQPLTNNPTQFISYWKSDVTKAKEFHERLKK